MPTVRAQQKPDKHQALVMLDAFASVGVRIFDITFTNIEEDKNGRQEVRGFREHRGLAEVRTSMPYLVNNAPNYQNNIILRPYDPEGVLLIQLDDLNSSKVERLLPHAFLVFRTSAGKEGTGNFQAWIAVKGAPTDKAEREDLVRRAKKAAGADATASGSTRIAGSINFKKKYASLTAFPLIEITSIQRGSFISLPDLERTGLVAAPEEPKAAVHGPSDTPSRKRAGRFTADGRKSRKTWPSYAMCIQGAPMAHAEDKRDISKADFTWCRTAIEWGWSEDATASRLLELSEKAKKNGESYALLTARKASESVMRRPYRSKSPRPD